MPSCSTSSNIASSINSLSVVQGGSRLMVSISASSNPGLTIGNVIRYDVINSGYTASKANDAVNSEVFGVIESYNSSNLTHNVVIYGSINLESSYLIGVNGSTGASGGNDIYFLSGITAGVLQNLAPSNLDHIIKPVYQSAPHGSYSGVVINYLGYRIGGDIEATSIDSELGNIQFVVNNNSFSDGYVDASVSRMLPVADFSEFYSKYEKQFGFEELILLEETPTNVNVNDSVIQPQSSYSGFISSVDIPNKQLYVRRPPNSDLANVNKQLIVQSSSTGTNYTFTIDDTLTPQIYGIYSPKIIPFTNLVTIVGSNNVELEDIPIKVGIKVKPQGVKVSIPSSATISSLISTFITIGTAASDLETILNNFEQRISTLENA